MSYSFGIQASDKEAAKQAVAAKFDEMVLPHQPIHQRDRAAVLANAGAAIDLLADDDSKDIAVSCNGYLSWRENEAITSATINCNASYTLRPVV